MDTDNPDSITFPDIITKTPVYPPLKDFKSVYEPTDDTFLFLDSIIEDFAELMKNRPLLISEIGPGSGCISVFCLKLFKYALTVVKKNVNSISYIPFTICVDINPEAAQCTATTATLNGVSEYMDVVIGDMYSPFRPAWQFDVALFNPPYVSTPPEEILKGVVERSWAGGVDGRQITDQFALQLRDYVHGVVYLLLERRNRIEDFKRFASEQGISFLYNLKTKKYFNEKLSSYIS